MTTIFDRNAAAAPRLRASSVWSAAPVATDRPNTAPAGRHVCIRSSVFDYDNSIGSTAVRLTMSGGVLGATKQAAPPRRVPR